MVKRALLIGINYRNDVNARLYGCINDAIAMQNLLIDAYSYEKSNITMLRDDNLEGFDLPTHNNIINILKQKALDTKEDDELWIHYSGHGSYIRDTNKDEYDGKDEVLIPCDYKTKGVIVDDELRKTLDLAKGLVNITLDCCHSGSGFDLPYLLRYYNNRCYRWQTGKTMKNKNIYMFSGARDNQTAADSYSKEQVKSLGAFTNAFIECVRFHNHNVKMLELYKDINLFLKTKGYSQICDFTTSNIYPFHVSIERSNIKHSKKILNRNIINNNMLSIINK